MLKTFQSKLIGVFFLSIIGLQLWLLFNLQLFGDESFYWLEGQFLSLSYSELPGWTAWMTRLGTSVFGNHYFAVRLVSYLGYLSVFFGIFLINKKLSKNKSTHQNYLILLAIPLYVLVAIMALPDIWLIVFVIWIIFFFIKAIQNNQKSDWLILGLVVACSLNVHVRMWIWLFFAGTCFLACFRTRIKIIRSVLFVTLPIALLGLIPILVFNYQNEFALLSFQFGQRHPWRFQLQNFSFILSQLLVITPLVLVFWYKNTLALKKYFALNPILFWILLTAVMHWVFYVVVSLFADGLRTTVHWLLISYVPVLAVSSHLTKNNLLTKLAIVTGGIASLLLLSYLSFNRNYSSNIQARILDNSLGWNQLSQAVFRLEKDHKTENIITDYFMTASELAFELDRTENIKVLPHPKNTKHGREKQLEIMNMLLKNPEDYQERALLVIEDSGIKLQDKGKYYSQLCDYFNRLKYLETLNVNQTKKKYHFFKIDTNLVSPKLCQIPPLFYVEQKIIGDQIIISGWAILHNLGIETLMLKSAGKTLEISNDSLINTGIAQMFPKINDKNAPNNAFEITVPISEIQNKSYQILAIGKENIQYFSQNYFID